MFKTFKCFRFVFGVQVPDRGVDARASKRFRRPGRRHGPPGSVAHHLLSLRMVHHRFERLWSSFLCLFCLYLCMSVYLDVSSQVWTSLELLSLLVLSVSLHVCLSRWLIIGLPYSSCVCLSVCLFLHLFLHLHYSNYSCFFLLFSLST